MRGSGLRARLHCGSWTQARAGPWLPVLSAVTAAAMTGVMQQLALWEVVVLSGFRCVANQREPPIATMKSWRQTGMNALRDVMGRGSIGVFEAMSIMNTAPISLLAELPRMVSVRLSKLSFQEF